MQNNSEATSKIKNEIIKNIKNYVDAVLEELCQIDVRYWTDPAIMNDNENSKKKTPVKNWSLYNIKPQLVVGLKTFSTAGENLSGD